MLTHCAAQVEQLRLDAAAEARLRQRTLLLHDEPITGTPVRHEAWARASAATSLCDVVRVGLSRALPHTPQRPRHTAPFVSAVGTRRSGRVRAQHASAF